MKELGQCDSGFLLINPNMLKIEKQSCFIVSELMYNFYVLCNVCKSYILIQNLLLGFRVSVCTLLLSMCQENQREGHIRKEILPRFQSPTSHCQWPLFWLMTVRGKGFEQMKTWMNAYTGVFQLNVLSLMASKGGSLGEDLQPL